MQLHKLFSYNNTINYKQETIAGIITFLSMSYIIMVNPQILHANGAGFPLSPMVTSTLLATIICTLMCGFFTKLPFAMAPGMGLNAVISYTLIIHDKLSINMALGVIVLSSVVFVLLSVFNLQKVIIKSIPQVIQESLGVGIGAFLIFIGLKNSGIIVANPITILSLGEINIAFYLSLFGFFITAALFIKKKIYAIILPIILISVIHNLINQTTLPAHIISMPDFSLFMKVDCFHSLQYSIIPPVISLFIITFFDSSSSLIGLNTLLKARNPELTEHQLNKSYQANSVAGIISGLSGTSGSIIFVESASGIESGAKTGFSAIIVALCFVPFLFMSPLIEIIPFYATSSALILVGILMCSNLSKIKINNLEDTISIVFSIIMMPLCFSITAGAVFGILSYTILKILLGKYKEINIGLIIISLCCIVWLYHH